MSELQDELQQATKELVHEVHKLQDARVEMPYRNAMDLSGAAKRVRLALMNINLEPRKLIE